MQQLRIAPSGPNADNFATGAVVDNGLSNALSATTIDWSASYAQKVTLNANTALALFHGWPVGKSARGVLLVEAGAGGFTPTLPAVIGGAAIAWTTTAGQVNAVDLFWDGARLFASLLAKSP